MNKIAFSYSCLLVISVDSNHARMTRQRSSEEIHDDDDRDVNGWEKETKKDDQAVVEVWRQIEFKVYMEN